jgi:hypothetical protein
MAGLFCFFASAIFCRAASTIHNVIPAQAGIHASFNGCSARSGLMRSTREPSPPQLRKFAWVPAFAGMTPITDAKPTPT